MIINGKKLAKDITDELKKEVALEKEKGNSFGLGVILIDGNPTSDIYVSKKQEMAEKIGVDFYLARFNNPKDKDLIKKIKEWNKDKKLTGIIVQLPLWKGSDPFRVVNHIDPRKDVDGLTDFNQSCLNEGREGLYPATPMGVLGILKEHQIEIKDKNIAVLGRSRLVGIPLSILLGSRGGNVQVCDSQTENTTEICKNADILISAVGKPGLVTKDMVKKGAVVIDVGTTKVEGVLKGDVDFENVKDIASYITPVPGGVGPLTVASLMKNVVKAGKMN